MSFKLRQSTKKSELINVKFTKGDKSMLSKLKQFFKKLLSIDFKLVREDKFMLFNC